MDEYTKRNEDRARSSSKGRPVVKGEWLGEGDGYADGFLVLDTWSCSVCGKYFPEWEEKPDWNYCPNCGADMQEADSLVPRGANTSIYMIEKTESKTCKQTTGETFCGSEYKSVMF